MDAQQIANLEASSTLAWVSLNGLLSENQKPIEFRNHRFMIQIYADNHPDIVCKKSAQVGFSIFSILKSFHELKYEKRNVIYALPTKNVVQDFVIPKVNPLITSNPKIAKDMGGDSVSLKKFGDRFIYFKGGSEREAISVSADTLVIDELDRMPDHNIVTMFDSRLQAAESPRRRRFSNPSAVGFGVDGLYNDSDMQHWMVTHDCGHISYMDFNREEAWKDKHGTINYSHYIDKERIRYACGECSGEITNKQRRNGEWIAKNPSSPRRGYWISQMMAPWVTAQRILEQYGDMDIATFHAMVLGKAYTPSDLIVNRDNILRACAPSNIQKVQVAMGIDQDAGGQYVTLMTMQGIFSQVYVHSWEEVEHIKLMYNAVVVCDPAPYPTIPKQMAVKYNDWYNCYFSESKDMSSLRWNEKEQTVSADRTRMLDMRANEIINARMLYRQRPSELESTIAHWNNLYRTTEEKDDGRIKSVWIKKDGKQSDWPFSETYARIALIQVMGGDSSLLEPTREPDATVTNVISTGAGATNVDFSGILEETFNEMGQ